MRLNFIASLVAVVTLFQIVAAFPSGAGGCSAGNKAVAGSHLSNAKTTGSLASAGLSISVGGKTLVAGSTTTFPINTNTVVKINSKNKSFKGFLVRLGETGGVSTDSAWSVSSSTVKKASACTSVGGVTHTSSSAKTSVSATLKLTKAATKMPLDVTIVISNGNGQSEYYYSRYFLTSM